MLDRTSSIRAPQLNGTWRNRCDKTVATCLGNPREHLNVSNGAWIFATKTLEISFMCLRVADLKYFRVPNRGYRASSVRTIRKFRTFWKDPIGASRVDVTFIKLYIAPHLTQLRSFGNRGGGIFCASVLSKLRLVSRPTLLLRRPLRSSLAVRGRSDSRLCLVRCHIMCDDTLVGVLRLRSCSIISRLILSRCCIARSRLTDKID
jgi:hypothetical protein